LTEVTVITASKPEREHLLREAWQSVEQQTVECTHLAAIDEHDEGPAKVRNWLANKAVTEWLLPLDDDDLLGADCVELLLDAGGADIVYPWCRITDHAENLAAWSPNRLFDADALLRGPNYIPVTALVRRDLWMEVGGMRTLRIGEDWDMWKRCLAAGARFRYVPEVLWTYRRGIAGSRNQWVNEPDPGGRPSPMGRPVT
jgi:glycosyltransferase involved in cell wall biosynthesis